jgi:hypothetical protein
MPTPTNNDPILVDAAGIDRRIMLLPGEVSITTRGIVEKSADAVVVVDTSR